MSTNYDIDPKEWIAGIVNAHLSQLTITEENAVVTSVDEVLGRPNEIIVTLRVDRNHGVDKTIGIKEFTKPYLNRRVRIVRKVAYDIAKNISDDAVIRLYTPTLPSNTLDVVNLLNRIHNLNIDPEDVYNIPVTAFGPVRIIFKATGFEYYGTLNTVVLGG